MSLKQCLIILCSLLPLCAAAQNNATAAKPAATESAKKSLPPEPAVLDAKSISYGEHDVIRIHTKLRYTTLIVLPKNEQILDFTCGDKEFWVINGSQNFAYIKPSKAGAQTNVNLVTASGNVYSFVLVEVSERPDIPPDLKVFVELRDNAMVSAADGPARFISTREIDKIRHDLDAAKSETQAVRQASQSAVDSGISRFISNVRFGYQFEAGKKPFYVRAMYHDDKFTYIQARPEETPTLYEVKDGRPNLINFEYKNGLYVAEKILDRGFLVIGKRKLAFVRED